MELTQILSSSTEGRVVIVDDYYATPDLTTLDAEAFTRFYHHIDNHPGYRSKLAKLLNAGRNSSAANLMPLAEANPRHLWETYKTDAAYGTCLAPLFSVIDFDRDGDRAALQTITDFCRQQLQIEPKTFGSLEDAQEALKNCSIAFVDFRFKASIAVDRAIEVHRRFQEAYRSRYQLNEKKLPKIIYLISSSLPRQENLEAFRIATGIRAAFFNPLRKSEISPDVLAAELARWQGRYSAAFKLDMYLSEITEAVSAASSSLCGQIDGLELHELALLTAFKLAVDQESLQNYLTWLLSEALASKLRATPALQPKLLPKDSDLPLDGKLRIGTVLFELFSQIAISPVTEPTSMPAFGDVYAVIPQKPRGKKGESLESTRPAGTRDMLLAISPACDLQRCSSDDMVLCVRGVETETKPNMQDLLKHGVLFGQGSHVIQYQEGNDKKYGYLQWNRKQLVTISVKDLINKKKYSKVARLSELFAQEAKEQALSNASRIGLPVYPSFRVSTKTVVRMKFGNVVLQRDLTAIQNFESAIVIKGRRDPEHSESGEHFIAFTEQFANWMRTQFMPEARVAFGNNAVPAQFANVEQYMANWSDLHIELSKSKRSELGGVLMFMLVEQLDGADAANNRVEVVVSYQSSG